MYEKSKNTILFYAKYLNLYILSSSKFSGMLYAVVKVGNHITPVESKSIDEVFGARYPVPVYGNFSDFYISLYEYN
jgi:hypothetical protein